MFHIFISCKRKLIKCRPIGKIGLNSKNMKIIMQFCFYNSDCYDFRTEYSIHNILLLVIQNGSLTVLF